jgi:TatA/E family protein of Tat protein translocase
MGLDNPLHIAFLLVILLLVFGAKRLPELGRSLGSGMRGFKESISGEGHSPDSAITEHVDQTIDTPALTTSLAADKPVADQVAILPVHPVA